MRLLHILLALILSTSLAACPSSRRRAAQDDDDTSDDDDAAPDDDDTADDDDTLDDDDDSASDDDDVAPDDDDATPDPLPGCMETVLEYIAGAGILPEQTVLGDLPAQQLYSCETYQLLGVTLMSTPTAATTTGEAPAWTLEALTPVAMNDAAAPATLSLTGCDPYTCSLYTNTFDASTSVPVAMSQSQGPGDATFLEVAFGTPSYDIPGQLQSNFIITDCSLGNLNEDLQANGVDIFTVLINDLSLQWGLAIQQHLLAVEAEAEELSYSCWEEGL